MLFIAIPAHNEVDTIGVLLWRLRSVLARFPREYHVVVFDDASTDSTLEVLSQYEKVLPLTILGVQHQVGYARAVDALLRHIVSRTRHARRDAILVLQGDFTDPPELIPEFARRFEGGADLVVGERIAVADAPSAVHRLFRYTGWSTRPFVRIDGVRDVTSTFRLVRTAVVRDLLRECGDAPLLEGNSWTANGDLLLRMMPHARRMESVPVQSTYGVRMRDTRRDAVRDGLASLKWAWSARKRRPALVAREESDGAQVNGDRDAERTARVGEEAETATRPRRDRSRRDRPRRDGQRRDGSERRPRDGTERARREERDALPHDPVGAGPVPDVTVISDRTRERRRRRKRRSDKSDVVSETLSLVDPAAGLFAPDVEETDAAGTTSEERRRKRKRRRSKSRSRGESTEAAGAAADAEFAATDAPGGDMPQDDVVADDNTEDDASLEAQATRRRRRGRRGKRGGRRSRRPSTEDGEENRADDTARGVSDHADERPPAPRDE